MLPGRLAKFLEHPGERVGVDVDRAGERVVERDDDDEAQGHQKRKHARHGNLRKQVLDRANPTAILRRRLSRTIAFQSMHKKRLGRRTLDRRDILLNQDAFWHDSLCGK